MNNTHVFEISLAKLQNAFTQMEHEAGWNINEKLIWGYYFLDHDVKKLEDFAEILKKNGFEIVEVRQIENESLSLIHVEEHVVHSTQSLFNRCKHLASLANNSNIEIFDGWDAEQKQINKGLIN